MKFSPLGFREVLSTGRGTAPKSRMEQTAQMHSFTNKVLPYNARAASDMDTAPNKEMYANARRMNKESEAWYTTKHEDDVHVGERNDFQRDLGGVGGRSQLGEKNASTYVRSSSAYGTHHQPAQTSSTPRSLSSMALNRNNNHKQKEEEFQPSRFGRKTADFNQRQTLSSGVGLAALAGGIPSKPAPLTAAALRAQQESEEGGRSSAHTDVFRRVENVDQNMAEFDPIFSSTVSSIAPATPPPELNGEGRQQFNDHQRTLQQVGREDNGKGTSNIMANNDNTIRCIGAGTYQANPYPRPDQLRQPYATSAAGRALPAAHTYADPSLGVGLPRSGGRPFLATRRGQMGTEQGGATASMYRTTNSDTYGNSDALAKDAKAAVTATTTRRGVAGESYRTANKDNAAAATENEKEDTDPYATFDPFGPEKPAAGARTSVGGVVGRARGGNNNILSYNDRWQPPNTTRISSQSNPLEKDGHYTTAGGADNNNFNNQKLMTTVATTTQGGVPLASQHTADERRARHTDLGDTVVQRVVGPPKTSIGAAALEAIRKEKRYRVKVSQMVAELEAECAALGGRLGGATTTKKSYAALNDGIPLISAGGPISRHAQMLQRLDAIQAQIRRGVISRAGPASTFEQRARLLQSILEQYCSSSTSSSSAAPTGGGNPTRGGGGEDTSRNNGAVSNPNKPSGMGGGIGDNISSRRIGAIPGQPIPKQYQSSPTSSAFVYGKGPVAAANDTGGATSAQQRDATEVTADLLVNALRVGFAIPITYDEADAFIDHCDVDEKGSVSAREIAEGVMAGSSCSIDGTPTTKDLDGGESGVNPQIENILKNGPNSPHAAFYKASDIFAYIRRRRLGALADPAIRRIILSIKARLLERSIANVRHLAPDSLAQVGSMRSYLVAILTRFPTRLALTSPEAYYKKLRQLELEDEKRLKEAEEEAHVISKINGISNVGNNNRNSPQQQQQQQQQQAATSATNNNYYYNGYGSSALRHGRPSYGNANMQRNQIQQITSALNPITNTVNGNGYGSGPPPPPPPTTRQLPPNALEQRVIAPEDLLNGLQTIGVRGITMAEVTSLLRAANTPEGIEPKQLVALLRGSLPRRRRQIIREVFCNIDADKDGVLSVSEVMGNFDASAHPAVLIGEATAEEVKRNFMACWLNDTNGDGVIDWSEFLATYKDLSDEIENDDYFELVMRNCWHLSGGSTALATNTTCRRVLVTFYDGSQRVEEIKNDIGIRPSDKQTMIRRLEQQGCRGVASVELYG